jgi:prolyl-tRNA synthetase
LRAAGIRADIDHNDAKNPGFKYNYWEQRGTPIRLELGARDFAANEVRLVKRVDNEKF